VIWRCLIGIESIPLPPPKKKRPKSKLSTPRITCGLTDELTVKKQSDPTEKLDLKPDTLEGNLSRCSASGDCILDCDISPDTILEMGPD